MQQVLGCLGDNDIKSSPASRQNILPTAMNQRPSAGVLLRVYDSALFVFGFSFFSDFTFIVLTFAIPSPSKKILLGIFSFLLRPSALAFNVVTCHFILFQMF